MKISLTGFMGCGKSSVGKVLSELLCCRFVDLDQVIEEMAGRSVQEIFAADGEEGFRRMEKEALEGVLRGRGNKGTGQSLPLQAMGPSESNSSISGKDAQMVLALGGGAVMREECEKMIHEETFCIYLKASVDTLVSRLTGKDSDRPLLQGDNLRTRIRDLMSHRAGTYGRTAHLIVDTDGKGIREIAEEIIMHLTPSTRVQG